MIKRICAVIDLLIPKFNEFSMVYQKKNSNSMLISVPDCGQKF